MAEWLAGQVTGVERWTETLFSLKLKADIYPFKAGQYCKLALNIAGERIARAYSFVNAPQNNCLEFYIVDIANGKLSPHLHQLCMGNSVWITKESNGFFVLDEVPDCNTLWMLATGTALGPYLSMLQSGSDLDRFKHIVLIHAVRYQQDLSYWSLMQTLVQQYQGKLIIKAVLSQDDSANALSGRLPELIANGKLEASIGLPINKHSSHVMLCGNPQMITDCREVLKHRDMLKHLRRRPGHITSEHFW